MPWDVAQILRFKSVILETNKDFNVSREKNIYLKSFRDVIVLEPKTLKPFKFVAHMLEELSSTLGLKKQRRKHFHAKTINDKLTIIDSHLNSYHERSLIVITSLKPYMRLAIEYILSLTNFRLLIFTIDDPSYYLTSLTKNFFMLVDYNLKKATDGGTKWSMLAPLTGQQKITLNFSVKSEMGADYEDNFEGIYESYIGNLQAFSRSKSNKSLNHIKEFKERFFFLFYDYRVETLVLLERIIQLCRSRDQNEIPILNLSQINLSDTGGTNNNDAILKPTLNKLERDGIILASQRIDKLKSYSDPEKEPELENINLHLCSAFRYDHLSYWLKAYIEAQKNDKKNKNQQ